MRVSEYLDVISKGNQNTYKYALGYALAVLNPQNITVSFEEIAEVVVQFYYERAILSGLSHSNNEKQRPKVIQMIEETLQETGKLVADQDLPNNLIQQIARKIIEDKNKGFFKYVLPCWEGAKKDARGYYQYPSKGENSCFSYSLEKQQIILKEEFKKCINDNNRVLEEAILDQLGIFLKKYNKEK